VTCADFTRHELLLECAHGGTAQVQVTLEDGCSARLCQGCFTRLGIRRWPDLAGYLGGPGRGLDLLQLLRAATRAKAR
jgi:hypothetical protein